MRSNCGVSIIFGTNNPTTEVKLRAQAEEGDTIGGGGSEIDPDLYRVTRALAANCMESREVAYVGNSVPHSDVEKFAFSVKICTAWTISA